MAKHLAIGKEGERLAASYLAGKGYDRIAENWRYKKAEIDLIFRDGEELVFVEVKTRTNVAFGTPEMFVDKKKERLMMDAANHYIDSIGYDGLIRFDIVAVILSPSKVPKIDHFKDAFFPAGF